MKVFTVKKYSGREPKPFDLKIYTLPIALLRQLQNGVIYPDSVTYILKCVFSRTLAQCSLICVH